jgi:hypothetical protein
MDSKSAKMMSCRKYSENSFPGFFRSPITPARICRSHFPYKPTDFTISAESSQAFGFIRPFHYGQLLTQ